MGFTMIRPDRLASILGSRPTNPLQGTPTRYQPSEMVEGMEASITSRGGSGAPLSGRSICCSEFADFAWDPISGHQRIAQELRWYSLIQVDAMSMEREANTLRSRKRARKPKRQPCRRTHKRGIHS